MDDEQLVQALGDLKRQFPVSAPGDPRRTAECLTYLRARAVALDPAGESARESAHLRGCRRCRQTKASFTRHLPHLSLWTLIRRRLGLLLPSEARVVEYHLEAGRCQVCAARAASLAQARLAALQLPRPLAPANPRAASAAGPAPEVLAKGQQEGLLADLVPDRDGYCLEVRTHNPRHFQRLVAYVFEGASGEALREGYLVLGLDDEEWYSAHELIAPDQFRAEVESACQALRVAVVEPAFLSAEEWQRVAAAAPGAEADAGTQADWLAFCRRSQEEADLSPDATEALRAISDRLTGSDRSPEAERNAQTD